MAHSEGEARSGSPTLGPATLSIDQLFSQVRDAIVVADSQGRIVLWNPAAARLFGYTAEEARGAQVAILVPERLRGRHDAGMERFREFGTGPLIEAGAVLELPARTKDGREITIEMTLSHLDEGDGRVMAIIRDVTERVRLREDVNADHRRLREANESLESFSYVVGHDLKEPVRAVEAYLEAIQERVVDTSDVELVKKARDANRRMRGLLEGLIEWGRATTTALDVESLDLRDVLLAGPCRARYQHAVQERGARLEVIGGFPPVLATEGLLCQLFGNVILNAVRHNPRPDPRVSVQALGEEAGQVCVAVRDNGPGFPREVRQRVERMRATRPTTVRGGFGMTIALRSAHLLGGRIELGDAPGGGAEVRVWLRVAKSP